MKSTNRLKFYCNESCPKVALHANMGLQKDECKRVRGSVRGEAWNRAKVSKLRIAPLWATR